MPDVSVIISFYNKIDYLKLVFAGLQTQSYKNFEAIIADDGSELISEKQIELLTKDSFFPVVHLWQEDKGFRKNRILNRAIENSKSSFLIFIDGDCIPHPKFIQEHLNYKQSGKCNTGRRINLSEKLTGILSVDLIKNNFFEKKFYKLIADGLFGQTRYVEKGIYLKNNFLRSLVNKKKRGLLGCNFSINKEDILSINGFDERYQLPSIGEDSDIQFRLELNGIKIQSLCNIAVQYHLYHKLQERPQENLDLFEEVKKNKIAFTPFGIIKK